MSTQTVSEDRMAVARRALQRAEAAAGLRTRLIDDVAPPVGSPGILAPAADNGTSLRPPGARGRAPSAGAGPLPWPAGSPRTGAGGGVDAPVRAVPPGTGPVGGGSPDHLPVPAALTSLLPPTGLRRGTVVQVGGSTSLLLALVAAAVHEGAWAALAALPDVGLAAAAEAGLVLERSVLVPRPGPEAAAVLGALVDGFDVLAVGPTRALSDRDRRLLSSRLRSRGAVLLSAAPWPGADVVLRAGQMRPSGLGQGWGSLQGQDMTVHGRSRWTAGGRVHVRVGQAGLVALDDVGRGGGVVADGPVADDRPAVAPVEPRLPAVTAVEQPRLQAVS